MAHTGETPHPRLYNLTVGPVFNKFLGLYGGVSAHGLDEALADLDGPYMLAPVHKSLLDVLAVSAPVLERTGTQIHYFTKEGLWRIPGLGPFIAACGAIRISQKQALPPETIERVEEIVANKGVFGLFPEGTRGDGDDIKRKTLKRGIAALSLQYGLPTIPVGVSGTHKDKRGPIHLVFGKPINVNRTIDNTLDASNPRSLVEGTREFMAELFVSLSDVQRTATAWRDGTQGASLEV